MSVLNINCSARINDSNSRELTQYLIDMLDEKVVYRDLAEQCFPALSSEDLMDMHNSIYSSRESFIEHNNKSNELVAEVKNSSTLVFGVPIYNFTIPTVLNQWVDYIVKSGVTFKYYSDGPKGLCNIKKAFIVTSSGGTKIGSDMDFASPYIEKICKFIGVDQVYHIKANGSKGMRKDIIDDAKKQIDDLFASF